MNQTWASNVNDCMGRENPAHYGLHLVNDGKGIQTVDEGSWVFDPSLMLDYYIYLKCSFPKSLECKIAETKIGELLKGTTFKLSAYQQHIYDLWQQSYIKELVHSIEPSKKASKKI